jgi:hypothetical protein
MTSPAVAGLRVTPMIDVARLMRRHLANILSYLTAGSQTPWLKGRTPRFSGSSPRAASEIETVSS